MKTREKRIRKSARTLYKILTGYIIVLPDFLACFLLRAKNKIKELCDIARILLRVLSQW
jgi:hypothetical protein